MFHDCLGRRQGDKALIIYSVEVADLLGTWNLQVAIITFYHGSFDNFWNAGHLNSKNGLGLLNIKQILTFVMMT